MQILKQFKHNPNHRFHISRKRRYVLQFYLSVLIIAAGKTVPQSIHIIPVVVRQTKYLLEIMMQSQQRFYSLKV